MTTHSRRVAKDAPTGKFITMQEAARRPATTYTMRVYWDTDARYNL